MIDLGKIQADIATIIADSHRGLDFGVADVTIIPPDKQPVNVQLKKHDGAISTINISTYTTTVLEDNTDAIYKIGQLIKLMDNTRNNGNLTFTLSFKDGKARKMQTQNLQHHTSKQWA